MASKAISLAMGVSAIRAVSSRNGFIAIGCFVSTTLFLLLYLTTWPSFSRPSFTGESQTLGHAPTPRVSCSPEDYASGSWSYRSQFPEGNVSMTRPEDAFLFNRFEGCASSREFWWHLGADNAAQWDRYPNVTDWRWVPGEKCLGLRQLDGADLVRDLVEMGGWLILGGMCALNQPSSRAYSHIEDEC